VCPNQSEQLVSPDGSKGGVGCEFLASIIVVLDYSSLGRPVAASKGVPAEFILFVHCMPELRGGGVRHDGYVSEPCRESVDKHAHQFKIGIVGYHPLADSGEESASPCGDWGGGASQKVLLVIELVTPRTLRGAVFPTGFEFLGGE
jgi:hypothetical protein